MSGCSTGFNLVLNSEKIVFCSRPLHNASDNRIKIEQNMSYPSRIPHKTFVLKVLSAFYVCYIYSSAHHQGRKHYEVMDPYQTVPLVHFGRPDLDPNSLQKLSAEDISRLPGKSVIRLTDLLVMTMAVLLGVNPQTKKIISR